MNNEQKQFMKQILGALPFIAEEDIPNIDLYMDQVTTLMDKHLSSTKRDDEDKILTKTMINNYAKNDLLPPPIKKKYSKEHVILLIFIYYFKNVLSINDIGTLLSLVKENHFSTDSEIPLSDIYKNMTDLMQSHQEQFEQEIMALIDQSSKHYSKKGLEDLQEFLFLSLLCFDIYRKKQLIETILDKKTEKKDL